MRHRHAGKHLNRTPEHRISMLRNLTRALLTHGGALRVSTRVQSSTILAIRTRMNNVKTYPSTAPMRCSPRQLQRGLKL